MVDRSPSEHMAGYLVKRVQQALRRNCDAALRPTGLSMAQYAVLRALADHPDASAAELARLCFVTRQSLHDVLAGLRAAAFVAEVADPPPGRARPLELTPLGRRRLRSAQRAIVDVESAMTAGMSTRDHDRLAELLTTCAENLEA